MIDGGITNTPDEMSLDDAEAVLNRVLKEHRAFQRMHAVIEVARKYRDDEKKADGKRAAFHEELLRLEKTVADAAKAVELKRVQLHASLDAFEAELRDKRTSAERDFLLHDSELSNRLSRAEQAVKSAEIGSASQVAEIRATETRLAAEHAQSKKDRQSELSALNEHIKTARREIEVLRSRLVGA